MRDCIEWTKDVESRLLNDDTIGLVVFHNRTSKYRETNVEPVVVFESDSVAKRLTAIEASGKSVAVVRDVPGSESNLDAVDCVASRERENLCSCTRSVVVTEDAMTSASEVRQQIDLSDHFCAALKCYVVAGGVVVYFDGNHLTHTFAASLSPYLGSELERMLAH